MGRLLEMLKVRSKSEDGGILVLVALSLVVLLGFAALVIDGGLLYAERSKLQKTMDAAVLAAAYESFEEEGDVVGEFRYVSEQNGFPDDGVALSFDEETSVEGDKRYVSEVSGSDYNVALTVTDDYVLGEVIRNKDLTLANVLDFSDADVFASSKAIFSFLNTGKNVSPMFVSDYELNTEDNICLKRVSSGSDSDCPSSVGGNFGFLDYGDSLKDSLVYSHYEVTIGDEIPTENGNSVGHWRNTLQDWLSTDEDDACHNYNTATLDCERVILVPTVCVITDDDEETDRGDHCINEDDLNGKTGIEITGFAAFWLVAVDDEVGEGVEEDVLGEDEDLKHAIIGKFLETYTSGDEIEDILCGGIEGCSEDANVNVVRLVDPASD
ncbi:Tad domain-containing protein [Alkalibacillus haloalkaliphilus]|uniref:Putative Flp pilus-assembly TadG-like N-terminal domain-containing protein n=1 Tax=Alkalibacillus haloalkaliphilus TaxID=94136 RepID=A0A511W1V9_9BACI|nr:Tad domain-containing protein [Alkalibacillus haloalkaliphilus]GEN45079.1 hypothetical protein AHA02nite_08550 [Alkalibacillus haloalkaliphilus]